MLLVGKKKGTQPVNSSTPTISSVSFPGPGLAMKNWPIKQNLKAVVVCTVIF